MQEQEEISPNHVQAFSGASVGRSNKKMLSASNACPRVRIDAGGLMSPLLRVRVLRGKQNNPFTKEHLVEAC